MFYSYSAQICIPLKGCLYSAQMYDIVCCRPAAALAQIEVASCLKTCNLVSSWFAVELEKVRERFCEISL